MVREQPSRTIKSVRFENETVVGSASIGISLSIFTFSEEKEVEAAFEQEFIGFCRWKAK